MMQRLREAVSVVKDILPVASAFAMVLGTTIIVSYSARLGYFPTGISAGDALFFLCLSMLVSASYLLAAYAFFSVTLFFCSVVRPVHNWLRKQREKEFTHYIPSKPIEGEVESALAGIIFLGIFVYVFVRATSGSEVEEFAIVAIEGAFFVAVAVILILANQLNAPQTPGQVQKFALAKKLLFLMFLAFPGIILSYQSIVHEPLLTMLGVRFQSSAIVFEGAYRDAILKLATKNDCQTEGATVICRNVEVALYGIGSQTILVFQTSDPKKKLSLAIPRDKIIVIR